MGKNRHHELDREIVELLERPVNVRKLVDRLTFQIEDIESAALKQPSLRLEAGRFRAQTSLKVSALKRQLSMITGERSLKIRHKRSGLTETAIKGRLALDEDVQRAQRHVDLAEVVDELGKQLIEAFKERTMMIAVLTKLKASEVSSHLLSVKTEEETSKMEHKARKLRDKLAEIEDDDD